MHLVGAFILLTQFIVISILVALATPPKWPFLWVLFDQITSEHAWRLDILILFPLAVGGFYNLVASCVPGGTPISWFWIQAAIGSTFEIWIICNLVGISTAVSLVHVVTLNLMLYYCGCLFDRLPRHMAIMGFLGLLGIWLPIFLSLSSMIGDFHVPVASYILAPSQFILVLALTVIRVLGSISCISPVTSEKALVLHSIVSNTILTWGFFFGIIHPEEQIQG